ncbi:hypothetical protein JTB14_017958 [Gonioctena quinquepunctata]|nr:hypothetical protein JTB14_017958 [Gonioctena quinquepunctata]
MAKKLKSKLLGYLKFLGLAGYSKRNNIYGLHPIIISGLYHPEYSTSDVFTKYSTLELCASCYELIIVADNWGVSTYALFLFLLTLWWSAKWEDASACPYNAIEDVIEGKRTLKHALLIIVSQILGGLITFRYVENLWALEMVETHRGKAYEECVADLQVDFITGALIEGIATCLCRLVSRILGDSNIKFGSSIDAFFSTLMVVAAFNFSGGYFNPALATSLKLGCEGNTFAEHMIVYWCGAILGSVLSVFLFKMSLIKNLITKMKRD